MSYREQEQVDAVVHAAVEYEKAWNFYSDIGDAQTRVRKGRYHQILLDAIRELNEHRKKAG